MIILIGIKIGMTRIFDNKNLSIPITIIKIYDNIITCINKKNKIINIQVTFKTKNKNKLIKPIKGICKKIKIKYCIGKFWSVPYIKDLHKNIGQIININLFKNIKYIDVTGFSKGKGFSGTIKRWNFKSQDSSHGNSLSHRVPGSIGQNQTPGRVFKGKKMSGHLGNKRITVQNLKILDLNFNKRILLVKGSIPGYNNNFLFIKSSIKKK